MKNMKVAFAAAALTFFASVAAAAVKPGDILMTVDGRNVTVSEFEYLFKKNNTQQIVPQSIDEYLNMFVDYKLKVAAAEHAGIDTTATFQAEYDKYRRELAAPYLRDKKVEEDLIDEAYRHTLRDVNVSHIMLMIERHSDQEEVAAARLDSIRNAILSGSITFEEAAKQFSADTPTAQNGGIMGWLPVGRYPWSFEKASYDTPVGGISRPVDSGYGIHIVKVNSDRPTRGEVKASHILKLTRGLEPEEAAKRKVAIDSIYQLLIAGADFAEVAKRESDDPGSATNGGDLGFFSSGTMVEPFDSISFSLKEGEISAPFATSFGYHIIKCTGHRDAKSKEELLDAIVAMMKRDSRSQQPYQERLRQLTAKYDGVVLKANLMAVRARLMANGNTIDSVAKEMLRNDATPIVKTKYSQATVAQAFASIKDTPKDVNSMMILLEREGENLLEMFVTDQAIKDLAAENQDYANLLNEYRDGILLFEISNQNVWDRANKDAEGLEKYFDQNRAKYTWEQPHYKGIIIIAPNDSILGEIKTSIAEFDANTPTEEVAKSLRKSFSKNIRIERVIAGKGENAIVDYLVFGGEKPKNRNNSRWQSYMTFDGKVIDQPEVAADVRGTAIADYQTQLEEDWVKSLRKQYKVKINKKVFDKIKKEEAQK